MELEYLIICLVAFLGSILTFFSGFGLGTLLVPVFAFFFPIDLAIAITAIVHFLNNLFKLVLVGKAANKKVLLSFGIPALLSSFLGAYMLTVLSDIPPLTKYFAFEKTFTITPVKLIMAILILSFALYDLMPKLAKRTFDSKWLPIGGILTGFFGGISGNQGALRSAFLSKLNLTKEAFVATGIVLAILIDIARLTVYSGDILMSANKLNTLLISAAALSAFAGAYIGSKLLKKITLNSLHVIVGITLIIFAVLLGAGII